MSKIIKVVLSPEAEEAYKTLNSNIKQTKKIINIT